MSRYRLIDFSRGLAAVAIAIVHWEAFMILAHWGSYDPGNSAVPPLEHLLAPIYEYGPLAVQYFWMISGFIFAFVYGKTTIGFSEYFGRRIARLYPLHIATLLAVTACQAVLIALVGTQLFYPEHDLYHFVLHLFFASSWGLEHGPSFNGPVWSVAVEVPVYALFWICVRKLPMNAATTLALAAVCFVMQKVMTFNQVSYCAMMFFLGATIFYVSGMFSTRALMALSAASWVVGIGVLLSVPALSEVHTLMLFIAFGPPLAIIAGFDQLWQGQSRLLDRLASFGDLSYSIYLVHLPLLMVITIGMVALGVERSSLSGNLVAMVLYLAATIWVSRLSYVGFEKPARRWLRGIFAPATGDEKRARASAAE